MLKAFLNKGGAGKSLDRAATAERLGRLMLHHTALMRAYDAAIHDTTSEELAAGLGLLNKTNRVDIGKYSELILSNGYPPPPTTELPPTDFGDALDDGARGRYLLDLERAYIDLIDEEMKAKHTFRAQATIENARANTQTRIDTIQRMGEKLRLGIR